jgi:hypothetical protein
VEAARNTPFSGVTVLSKPTSKSPFTAIRRGGDAATRGSGFAVAVGLAFAVGVGDKVTVGNDVGVCEAVVVGEELGPAGSGSSLRAWFSA